VEVGSELSGTVAQVDVDYNDQVKEGQVLASLDTGILKARLVEALASLQSARAKIAESKATVTETRVNLQRCQELLTQQMCSKSDLDKLQADFERAQASAAMARAQLSQAQATAQVQQTNLHKAVIRSPINGIVLDRKVEPGQTVAASFQTPVLFTIAEDLKQMELIVAVDEADVGQVHVDQQATFNVDAFPHRDFTAKVAQIRQAPKTVEGVVTYETLLRVDNSDLSLLPGMTATAQIVVKQIDNALLIPNAALRFTPPATAKSSGLSFSFFPRRHRTTERKAKEVGGNQRTATIWVMRNGQPAPLVITTGATNGQWTQVVSGELKEGMPVVVDAVSRGT